MKIRILPVAPEFQPAQQNFRCPTHGADWGVGPDFHNWLLSDPGMIANAGADWDYLPVYWNRYWWNNDAGSTGLDELQAEIDRLVDPARRTFTICEYDLPGLQPFLDLRGLRVFTASRRSDSPALIDVPLLCSPHEMPEPAPPKLWLASFNGNAQTDAVRIEMIDALRDRPGVFAGCQYMHPPEYARLIAASWIALAPRGQGAPSFRFYEAMQLGVVPLLISDIECRPFMRWLDWGRFSLRARSVPEAVDLLDHADVDTLAEMGRRAGQVYNEHLQYGRWCGYVVRELECLP